MKDPRAFGYADRRCGQGRIETIWPGSQIANSRNAMPWERIFLGYRICMTCGGEFFALAMSAYRVGGVTTHYHCRECRGRDRAWYKEMKRTIRDHFDNTTDEELRKMIGEDV